MRILITNIGELTTNVAVGEDPCGTLHDAAVLIEDGRVSWVGPAADAPIAPSISAEPWHSAPTGISSAEIDGGVEVVDAGGRAVIPGFVDSHSHLVFGGDRAAEFEARMQGQKYAAGGIRSTVAATRAASDDELRIRLRGFLDEMLAQGTTTVEIKSGYGLDVKTEERLVRLAPPGRALLRGHQRVGAREALEPEVGQEHAAHHPVREGDDEVLTAP